MANQNNSGTTAADSVIIACRACKARNRIPKSRLYDKPVCGKCRLTLNVHSVAGEEIRQGDGLRSREYCRPDPGDTVPAQGFGVGARIAGRFQIRDIFGGEGRSSMGVVYKCYDLEQDKIYALKTLQKKFLSSGKIVDAFKKEALAWIHLGNHPNIVRAYWVRELDGQMFVACEFIEPDAVGRNSLTSFLKKPFSLERVLNWSLQFCHGMEYACGKGVTPHRDIKPDNIMINMDGDVKITDFGLAGLWAGAEKTEEIKELMEKNQKRLAFLSADQNRIIAGSPPWMAPEQFYGIAEVRSDVYSFGIILFQLVNNGEHPFRLKKGDSWRTAHKEYTAPSVPKQGHAVAHIIGKCLEKRRDRRYANFVEIRKDLEDVFVKEITRETGTEPPAPPVMEEMKETDFINKGVSLANLGLLEEGIKNYRDSIRLNPKNSDAHYNLANALVQKGQLREAIRAYGEALKIEPGLSAAHFNLGIALFNNGQIDEAIAAYRDAIRTDPELDAAYVNLGVAFHKKGLTDKAILAYRDALRINPFFAEAHYKLGITLFAGNHLDEAIEAFREAIHIKPDHAQALNNLGSALMKKGLIDEAIRTYRNALEIMPGYADAHFNLGSALIRKNMLEEALTSLEEFMKHARKNDGRFSKAEETIGKLKIHLRKRPN